MYKTRHSLWSQIVLVQYIVSACPWQLFKLTQYGAWPPEVMLQYHSKGSGFRISDYGEESRISSWSWNYNCYQTIVQKDISTFVSLQITDLWACHMSDGPMIPYKSETTRKFTLKQLHLHWWMSQCANLLNWLMTNVGSNSTSSSIHQQN